MEKKRSVFAGILVALLAMLVSSCSITITGPDLGSKQTSSAPTISNQPSSAPNEMAQAVFNAINTDRKATGLPTLQWSTNLVNSAHAHNLAMQKANELSHQISGEPALGDREHQAGIQWHWAAENIGFTTERTTHGALSLHKDMMAEKPPDDGHRQNILAKEAAILGIDVLLDDQNGKIWLTEDFAHL